MIAFATSPGAFAFDGEGSNGVYTESLVEELKKHQRLEDVFMNTRIKAEKKLMDHRARGNYSGSGQLINSLIALRS